jgi:hypothetical protein
MKITEAQKSGLGRLMFTFREKNKTGASQGDVVTDAQGLDPGQGDPIG